jgi:hypothetical protein
LPHGSAIGVSLLIHALREGGRNQNPSATLLALPILIPEFCTKYRSEAQKALCLNRSWSDFEPQAYKLYGEDQNHETSFKDKALQVVVGTWYKIQVITS